MTVEAYRKKGKNFVFPGYEPKFPRNPDFNISHYKFKLKVYFNEKRIDGEATIYLSLRKKTSEIELDAVDMNIKKVLLNGIEMDFEYTGKTLKIPLKTSRFNNVLTVEYEVVEPKYGFHFITEYPMVYTQGEAEWNRYWLPIYDEPNMKFTVESIIYVPRGWRAYSNGILISHVQEEDWEVWHYKTEHKIQSYLIAVIAGDLYVEEDEVDGIKLEYIVPKIYRDRVKTTFKNTPDMIKFFNRWLGVKYPYGVYRQAAARNFLVGGMENLTLTIINDRYLMDEHSRKDFRIEGLLSHELAHQWFGDLVTCRDWSHIWINEGFATFLNNIYYRHWLGNEEYIYMLFLDMDSYLSETRNKYSRPTVYRVYKYPEELFDRHVYQKGGLLLNMLMNLVGEDKFRKIVKRFLTRYKYRNADTEDFRKTVEEITGENFEWFFETFFYNAGHPVIEVKYEYDRKSKLVKVSVAQKQDEDFPEIYKIPVEIEIGYSQNRKKVFMVRLNDRMENFYFESPKPPKYVLIDPGFKLFAQIIPRYGLNVYRNILDESDSTYWKLLSVRQLGGEKSSQAVDILAEAIVKEKFYGIAREAAKSLGKIGTEYAKNKILDLISKDLDPRVKASLIEALNNFRGPSIGERLLKFIEDDNEAYSIRANSLYTLAKTGYPDAKKYLLKYIDAPSYADIITINVLKGLAEIGDEEAYEIIKKYSFPEIRENVRLTAIEQLGNFPDKKEVYKLLKDYVKQGGERIRRAVVSACKKLMNGDALEILDLIISHERSGFVVKDAMLTRKKIQEALEKGVEYRKLREKIEAVEDEYRKIHEKIEMLERKL